MPKPLESEIKSLLSKQPLTGETAGRLMILDLLTAYKSLSEGGDGNGVLTDDEKIKIVNGLTFSDEIQRFNDYRGAHDYLTTAPVVYESYSKTCEVHYLKLLHLATSMRYAEDENNLSSQRPVIMTQRQHDEFVLSGHAEPPAGVAVLRDKPARPESTIDETGFYAESTPYWRQLYMAETVLRDRAVFITESIGGINDMLAECLARRKALELIARYIKVPQVKMLLPEPDKEKFETLNALMSDAINSVRRSGNPEHEREIKSKLSKLLQPIDLAALEPLPEVVRKERRFLNFSVIKNNSEAFVAAIKRGRRNDFSE